MRPTPAPLLLAAAMAALALVAAAPASAAPPRAATGDVLPFPAAERTLPNGLKVIVVPTGFPDLVSVQIPIQTGSRNEVEPGKTGFAHFFEHMMFRGTKAYPPDAYQAVLTRIGARQNAYTSDDLTNYHTTFAKEDLEKVLEIEADRFQHLDYSVEGFKTESRAILGEYNKNASNPLVKLEEVQRDAAFRAHTYKHTTMGFLADIEDMPNQYDYSRTFYARWYRPEHATVIVAGDVRPEQVFPLVEKYFGGWKRGDHQARIPAEPAPQGPVYAHVPWTTPTLPWVTVAFHGPAFSETGKDWAAVDLLFDLHFGETSDVYRKLVVDEQKVDALFTDTGPNVDPGLVTVFARLKKAEDAPYVRDVLLKAFAQARAAAPDPKKLADQKSFGRAAFVRRLDSTDAVAGMVARFAHFRRSYATANQLFRTYASLQGPDLLAAARRYFTDAGLVVTTLAKDPLPAAVKAQPALASLEPRPPAPAGVPVTLLPSKLPVVTVKLVFPAGSAKDPKGKEGLAALAADMLAAAGSQRMRLDEIREALHPLAASLDAQVDKEMVTLTGRFPADGWRRFADVALPQLTEPGFREEDFRRIKDEHLNALTQDLRESNDEELAKERLQANAFAGTPYGHPAIGTVAGIQAVTLEDVKAFVRARYARPDVLVGVGGDAPKAFLDRLQAELGRLPVAQAEPAPAVTGRRPKGLEVEIVQKDTRATAISFGLPIAVTRGHPDFPALWLAKTWLGEHRASTSHLYQRIREARGMNYGDYAYVEAFPRGMFQFFPDPNLARRAQLFEVWIRPVQPQNAQMAIRIALHELRKLVDEGLSQADFEATRAYLMKNVYVMTARQEQQVGYALDSRWYGIPEFTRYLRDGLAKLTREDVNRAIRTHLSATDLSFVIVTQDAKGLAAALAADGVSTVKYDAEKPAALLEEDRLIGASKLGIRPDAIRITPAADVFAR
ncbi:peptidase M16 domain protein [Anaeromyxobacter sp. K]|uniref:M16 family metallopeptidase n=1 Tax=Anaeromyxobacter sp. (strain K) TaxID=447217 RepID=UPI00015F8DAC|nr:M16 family metallopeptidase [Anaeromyxobacter sp. K]ACG72561.1 peptidase M16 domain protein [Anaeromyxobacter sp. K]